MVLDLLAIREALPHRYPFLLVDRIVELGDMRVVGIKNVTINEPYFQGHFPQKPVVPGVLIIESMAQVAGVLVARKTPDYQKKLMFLASIDSARFRRTVEPGDQMRIEVEITRFRPSAAKVAGRAIVAGQVVAEAELMCAIVDRPESEHAGSPDGGR